MLTPHDIEEYPLSKAKLGGYKCEEVDAFLDNVAADYQKLYDENLALTKKITVLVEKIAEYRKDEEYLKTAMVEAQRVMEGAERTAQERADSILNEAHAKSEEILSTSTQRAKEAETHFEQMRVEVTSFRNQLLNTYKSHIEIISALPVYEREEQEAARAAQEAAEQEAAAAQVSADYVSEDIYEMPVETAAVDAEEIAAVAEEIEPETTDMPPFNMDSIAQAIDSIDADQAAGEEGDYNTVNFDV